MIARGGLAVLSFGRISLLMCSVFVSLPAYAASTPLPRFNLRVRRPTSVEAILETIGRDDRVALTYKQSANTVFSFGRDYGHYGRILNQAVLVAPTLAVHNRHEVVGFCFTPQDGNALISSVAAAAWFVYPESYEAKLSCLKDSIFDEV